MAKYSGTDLGRLYLNLGWSFKLLSPQKVNNSKEHDMDVLSDTNF